MDRQYAWFIPEDQDDQYKPRNLGFGDDIKPWDDRDIKIPLRVNEQNRKIFFRCRLIKDETGKMTRNQEDSQTKLINQVRFKNVLKQSDRSRKPEQTKSQSKMKQIKPVLILHRRAECRQFRHIKRRNPKMLYESVKCRQFRADQSDLPVLGQSVRYEPAISRRSRIISNTSPISVGIPQHLRFLFDKPKTRAGGAAMNTRYSITRKRFKTEIDDEPEQNFSNSIMKITRLRFSVGHSKSPNQTSYDGGFL